MVTKVLTHVKDVDAVRFFADFGAGAVEIAHLVDIMPPSPDRGIIETTDIDTFGYRTHSPGLIEPGKVQLVLNFNPSDPTHGTATGLLSMFGDLLNRHCQVRWPDENKSQWNFDAFLIKVAPDAKLGAKVTCTCDFQVAAKVDFAAGPWVN